MVDTLPTRWLNVSHHSAAHIAARYPYAGYGSNLWLQQIGERCPQADTYGRGRLRGARLAFARVATIIADENVDTLVGISSSYQYFVVIREGEVLMRPHLLRRRGGGARRWHAPPFKLRGGQLVKAGNAFYECPNACQPRPGRKPAAGTRHALAAAGLEPDQWLLV